MTNAAAVIGLHFDSTDIQQNPIGVFLEIIKGLNEGPEVRGTDTIVPGLYGRIARNRIGDRLVIELEGYVAGSGMDEETQRSSFRTLVNQFAALFDPTAMPANLVADLEDGSTATVAARTLPTVLWQPIVPAMAKVNVQMEAVVAWDIVPAGS